MCANESRLAGALSKDSTAIFLFATIFFFKINKKESSIYYAIFSLLLSLLIEDFDGEFDVVGSPIGVRGDEAVGDTFHLARQSGLVLAALLFLLVLLPPADGILAFIAVVVGHVDDIGALELESADVGDGELAAVFSFGGKDGDGFGGGSVRDRIDLSLEGFFLGAQVAQEF